ncbi:MAG: hypothetical protein JXX29_04015 [Deltaproteobacteria bacterium]|nr:hypothetical protein [Deltaproteobacteria bacterium]
MNTQSLIPTPDTIPAPWWIFFGLGLVMFLLHILIINTLVGSSLIIAAKRLFGRNADLESTLTENLAVKTMTLFSFGINSGVAALLFLQVIYGHFMYASSVLMAVYWILVIPLLIIAYYGGYIYIRKHQHSPRLAGASIIVTALILLYIAFAFVNNLSLMAAPHYWRAYFDNRGGTILNTSDPTLLPRYLHFAVASISVAGLFLAWIHDRNAKRTSENKASAAPIGVRTGLRIFAVSTLIQAAVGVWYLLALPKPIMMSFMGKSVVSTAILSVGILLFLGAVFMAFKGKLKATLLHFLPLMLVMVIHRANLRSLQLEEYFSLTSLEEKAQYDVLALFLLVLLLGIAAIIYMIRLVQKNKGRKVTP